MADTDPASAPARASDLRTRFLSALVMAPPILAAAWYGGVVFEGTVVVLAALSVREWVRLVEPNPRGLATVLSHLFVLTVLVAAILRDVDTALWLAAGLTLVFFLIGRLMRMAAPLLVAAVVPYVAVAFVAIIWLRNGNGDAGLSLLLYLLFSVWATDVGGYAAGRTIGGPKLLPRVSPKKTWAGLIGGMALAALFGYGVALLSEARLPFVAAGVAMILAIAGQAGDLFESFIKRRSHVKDSGGLIPGHGGLLDRIDGLIVAAPVLALLHAILGEQVGWW